MSPADVIQELRDRARDGRPARLTPETVAIVAAHLRMPADLDRRFHFDPYSDGACVYRVDEHGDILEIVAWARGSLAAQAAFDYLVQQNPRDRYERRKRSWVEGKSHPDK